MKAAKPQQEGALYEFGSFRLDTVECQLLANGRPVELAPRLFDILRFLVQNNGHLVEKTELMNNLWPDAFVEESTMIRRISDLRRILAETDKETEYIKTVPKRGYRFGSPVRELSVGREGLVLERVTTSRRVVEEEERIDLDGPALVIVSHPLPAQRRSPNRKWNLKLSVMLISASLLLLLGAASFYFSRARNSASHLGIRSLAVLPFKPLAEQGSDEYLGPGIADSLISRLSNVSEITIRPTSAVLKYGGDTQDVMAAGRVESGLAAGWSSSEIRRSR